MTGITGARFELLIGSKDGDLCFAIYDNEKRITLARKILTKPEGIEAVDNLNFLHNLKV